MNVIEETAKKFNTTPEDVRKEISIAIQGGRNNPDPEVQAMWKRLFPDGKEPTPEQFIEVLSKEIRR